MPANLQRLVATGSLQFDVIDAMSAPLTKLYELDASFTATTLRQRLPDSFTQMTSLKQIRLSGCGGGARLTALPELGWDKIKSLRTVTLEVCLCVLSLS